MGINNLPAVAYDSFMGTYSALLSPLFVDFAGLDTAATTDSGSNGAGARVLDVGCGTGALVAELQSRLGPEAISAIDPSAAFVQAVRERYPRVDVRTASVESLPFADRSFDVTLAQLVLPVVTDPVAALEQMRRVTRGGGVVAANVWDFAGARSPFSLFWSAAREVEPRIPDESDQHGSREGSLHELFIAAGLHDVIEVPLEIGVEYGSFEEWFAPYAGGVGPAGRFYTSLEPARQDALHARCRARLPPAPFTVTSRAWAARGVVETL